MKSLSITLYMDNPSSWYVPYADALAEACSGKGHRVTRIARADDMPEGDCAFLLSAEKIVSPRILSRNAHTIVIHSSRVPEGKGWSPLTWQILEGKNEITVSLFEAAERVDSGVVYDREIVTFEGTELIDELRRKEAAAIQALALRFLDSYPPEKGEVQQGAETFYTRRTPSDSELDTTKPLSELFNQLRVVDNERYPAFFQHLGKTYILKIYEKE